MGILVSLEAAREYRATKQMRWIRGEMRVSGGHGPTPRLQEQLPGTKDRTDALQMTLHALNAAGQARNLTRLSKAHHTLAVLATGRGDWHTAAMHAVAALKLGNECADACYLILGLHQIQARESAPLAMRMLRAAFCTAHQAQDHEIQRLAVASLAVHCLVRRHPSAARFFLSRWDQLWPSRDAQWRACWLALSAWAASAQGNPQPGLARQATALAFSDGDDLAALFAQWALAEHYAATGQGEAAALCYEQSRRHLAQWLDDLSRQTVAPGDLLPMSVLGLSAMVGQARLSELIGTTCRPAPAGGRE